GIVSFLSGLLSLISVFLAYKLSFFGFLIGQLVRYILTFLIFYLINKVTLNLEVKLTYIKGLIVDGTPIILIVLSSYLVTLSDRLIIANYFDDKSLGLYGLAYLVINPFLLISGSVNSVLYTSFSSSFGKDKTFLSIGRVFRYTKVLIFIYSACIGLVYLLLPLVTSMFLPDYTDGIDAAKWLLVGHIFYFSGGILTNSYFTLNKQKNRLLIVLLALFVNITMSLILLKYIPDIVSVALGSVCSFIVLFGGLLFGLRFMSHFRNSDQLKGLGLLISFLVGGIVILVFLGAFEFHSNLVIDGLLKVLSFIIVYTVWAFLFNKSDLKKLGV
ncbi:MAG: oligosaccharide flippase family protein, partial [Marinoscillum sp.]